MWHDKPCVNGEPSSNNGWTYSAYSKYLAPDSLDMNLVQQRFQQCLRSRVPLKMDRLPNKVEPLMSKDEIIGAVSLGLLQRDDLANSHWNFCNVEYEPQKLTFNSVIKAVKALWKIRKEARRYKKLADEAYSTEEFSKYHNEYLKLSHRNYVWQEKITDAYPLAFYLTPWNQYYVNRYNGYPTTILQTVTFHANAIKTFINGGRSSRMLLWLQLRDMNHFLARFAPLKKWVQEYFYWDQNHDFVKNSVGISDSAKKV